MLSMCNGDMHVLPGNWISTTCNVLMLSNNAKFKYNFLQHEKVNSLRPSGVYICKIIAETSAGILSIRLQCTCFSEILIEIKNFHSIKRIWKCCLQNGGHFVQIQFIKMISHRCVSFPVMPSMPINVYILTHWDQVTHICVVKLIIIGLDNGVSPTGRRHAIIWRNAGILLIGPLGTNFINISTGIYIWICTWKCRLLNGVYFVSVSMC